MDCDGKCDECNGLTQVWLEEIGLSKEAKHELKLFAHKIAATELPGIDPYEVVRAWSIQMHADRDGFLHLRIFVPMTESCSAFTIYPDHWWYCRKVQQTAIGWQ
jgi:hypothetical protein